MAYESGFFTTLPALSSPFIKWQIGKDEDSEWAGGSIYILYISGRQFVIFWNDFNVCKDFRNITPLNE